MARTAVGGAGQCPVDFADADGPGSRRQGAGSENPHAAGGTGNVPETPARPALLLRGDSSAGPRLHQPRRSGALSNHASDPAVAPRPAGIGRAACPARHSERADGHLLRSSPTDRPSH